MSDAMAMRKYLLTYAGFCGGNEGWHHQDTAE